MQEPVTARSMIRLAVPAALSVILNNAWRVVDQYSVQGLGTSAQAAIGSFIFVLILCYAAWSLVAAGLGPLLARATGAGDTAMQRRVLGNGLLASIVVGLLVLGVAGLTAPTLAGLVGLEGEPARMAVEWMRMLSMTGLALAVAPVMDAAFFALGRTAIPMALMFLATALNAALNPLFIYTLGFGISGSALASGLSRLVTVLIGLSLLLRIIGPTWADLRPHPDTLRRIARVGAPVALNTANYALVYWAMLGIAISPLGPNVNAALGIGFSALEGFTWPLFHGISLAVASIVGRQLGAGRVDQALRAVRFGLPISSAAGLLAALAFYFAAEPLCAQFTRDPAVLREAVLYAQVLAFSQLFVAWESLSEGVLEGSGATRAIFIWSVPLNLLRIPLAYLFAFPLGMGAAGVWWAINLTTLAKAAGKGWSVWRGGWQTHRI